MLKSPPKFILEPAVPPAPPRATAVPVRIRGRRQAADRNGPGGGEKKNERDDAAAMAVVVPVRLPRGDRGRRIQAAGRGGRRLRGPDRVPVGAAGLGRRRHDGGRRRGRRRRREGGDRERDRRALAWIRGAESEVESGEWMTTWGGLPHR